MIEKRTQKNGRRAYRVRWREAGRGSPERMRSFDRHEDAVPLRDNVEPVADFAEGVERFLASLEEV